MATRTEIKRREKIACYFLDMSKLAFAGLVVGGLMPLLNEGTAWGLLNIALGIAFTVTFALIGNRILK